MQMDIVFQQTRLSTRLKGVSEGSILGHVLANFGPRGLSFNATAPYVRRWAMKEGLTNVYGNEDDGSLITFDMRTEVTNSFSRELNKSYETQ